MIRDEFDIANKQTNYFLLIWVADDVITRTSTEKKTQEEAMKRAKKEVVLSVQKLTKLEEELK